ncbi:antitoxin Xre/MbcA/ParS toxin-binding domain-containing protein [Lysobacter xanthus]
MKARPAPTLHALDVVRGNARASAEALALDARRAATGLGLDAEALGPTLDVDPPTAAGILAGDSRITPGSDLAERTLLLVRLHRALGDVYGSTELVHRWLDAEEPELGARPRDLLRSTDGLRRVVAHMEHHCKDCLW